MKSARIAIFAAVAALLAAAPATRLAAAGPAAPIPSTPGAARPRVALVLSGGSALGLAHIGVIRELERAGIPIDMVLGTSMGALIGGLYAAGYSPDAMEAIVENLDWSRYFAERPGAAQDRYLEEKHQRYPLDLGFTRRRLLIDSGLIEGQRLLALFSALTLHVLPERNFDDLPVPYRAVAADIITGEKEVFSSGSIAEAMRASMSIPGFFSPYVIDGRSFIDGGIADNMPVDIARGMGADIVIAVECRQKPAEDAASLDSALKVSNQTLNLFVEENMRQSRKEADLLIRPDLSRYGRWSFADAKALIAAGETGAVEQGGEIKVLADRIAASRRLVASEAEPNRAAMAPPPTLDRLEVDAPSTADEAVARKAFGGLLGRRLDRNEVEAAIDDIYESGDYSLVKLDLLPDPKGEGAIGVLRIADPKPHRDEILLGGTYRGLVSDTKSSEATIMTGLYFGNTSGRDSALFVEGGIGSLTRAYAEYFQPLGPLFALPFLRYQSQYDFYPLGSGLVLRANYRSADGGLALGSGLGKYAEVRLGWQYDSVLGIADDSFLESGGPLPSSDSDDAAFLFLSADYDNRMVSAFPEGGLAANLTLRFADTALGGSDSFSTGELRWNAAIPVTRSLTLGFAGYAATDFSGIIPGESALPYIRLFDLQSSGLFYGLAPLSDSAFGHHILGTGIELRQKLGHISRLLGGDIFGVANLSAAAVYEDSQLTAAPIPLRWNPSLGLGIRVTRNFGMLLTGGLVADSASFGSPYPSLGFQLGSFRDFPEDRR